MCGIVGQIGYVVSERAKQTALLKLSHRGPDADGNWTSDREDVWLGHRRLSIVDLSEAGNQPMTNEDGTIWLVGNGEIYNYPTLRRQLEQRQHKFYSNSDNEAIIHAYEEWGESCVEHIEGMFAFVLWDDVRKFALVARDHVGIKPLYYAPVEMGLAFASELKAIPPLLNKEPVLNPQAFAFMLSLGYVPTPHTIWQDVHKLEAGHYLTWSVERGIAIKCYWQPPKVIQPHVSQDWSELYLEVINDHLLSDVPLGLFLSGGIDSTSIALALSQLKQHPTALTVSLVESELDESFIAKDVVKTLGLDHEILPVKPSPAEILQRVIECFDEPQGYSALLTMFAISEAGAEKYKVILAGDGGDEVFGGYSWYRQTRSEAQKFIYHYARRLRNVFREQHRHMENFRNISPLHRHMLNLYPRFLPEEIKSLLSPMNVEFDNDIAVSPLKKYYEPSLPLQRALQRVDLMTFCTDSILPKVDRTSMAHGLEVRVPLLDRRVIEYGLQLPLQTEERLVGKPTLRRFIDGHFSDRVLNHPKQGFSMDVSGFTELESAVQTIREGYWVKNGLWHNWESLLRTSHPFQQARIWNLFVITQWANFWLDN